MNAAFAELLVAFEVHSVDRIRAVLDAGFDVRTPVNGKTPIDSLIEMYFRSHRFADCVRLLERGAVVDARADVDAFGMNGHTPLFHTVNSNANRSEPVMRMLLDAGARPDIRLAGITWGKGFEWETTCLDVTPISYAQLGLLPQMQRTEGDSYANVATLLRAAGRPVPPLANMPNRYLGAP